MRDLIVSLAILAGLALLIRLCPWLAFALAGAAVAAGGLLLIRWVWIRVDTPAGQPGHDRIAPDSRRSTR